VPERAPYGALGAGRLYVDVRVLLPVPLKPPNLVRRAGGNLLHGPVSLSSKQSTQELSEITCYPADTVADRGYRRALRRHGRAGA